MKKILLIVAIVIIIGAVIIFSLPPDRFSPIIQFLNSLGILPYLFIALVLIAISLRLRK